MPAAMIMGAFAGDFAGEVVMLCDGSRGLLSSVPCDAPRLKTAVRTTAVDKRRMCLADADRAVTPCGDAFSGLMQTPFFTLPQMASRLRFQSLEGEMTG
jgi:hypothetical protein